MILSQFRGRPVASMGIERSTFVSDEEGVIRRALRRVSPESHADDVLAVLG